MFATTLFISLHGVLLACPGDGILGPLRVSLPEFQLCCDLASARAEEGGHSGCSCMRSNNTRILSVYSAQCHLNVGVTIRIRPDETQIDGDVCFGVVCWVEQTPAQFVCNLTQSGRDLGSQAFVSVSWDCLQSSSYSGNITSEEAEKTVEGSCQWDDVIRCSVPLHTEDRMVLVTLKVSSGHRSVVSPAMAFVPQHIVNLDPPVNLQYNTTTEGELLLSWTDPNPTIHPLTYGLRYSSNSSLSSWMHLDGVAAQPVSLQNLATGVTYTVQVRSKMRDTPTPWSGWSEALHIYLHEVTYLPDTVLASSGSNVTVYCVINNHSLSARNVVWWLDVQEKVPESQYSYINEHVSSVTLLNVSSVKEQRFRLLHCCQQTGDVSVCSYSYAALYIKDINIAVSCETNGDLTAMTCRWNTTQWVRFLYRIRDLPCDVEGVEVGLSPVKECPVAGQGFMRCTLQPLLPVACYKMWLEFGKEGSLVKSLPIGVTPMEWIKPFSPFDLLAITFPKGFLKIEWKRHELPVYELQFEVRYAVDRRDAQWKVLGPLLNQSVVTPVLDPCSVYVVHVRCKHYGGPGLWSDWSDPYRTQVHNSEAPEMGPDFWRFLQKDPSQNRTNVTLLFTSLQRDNPLFCVEGFIIQHTSQGQVWSEKMGLVSSYTFQWTEEVHTVTVLAWNSHGSSTKNHNVTLVRPIRKPKLVSFFSPVRINSSCVSLTWMLVHNGSAPLSFVVEWRDPSTGGRVKWIRVPAHSHTFYLHDSFFSSEEYSFILYPIFVDGEGEPVYAKEDRGHSKGQHMASVLLLVIAFLSAILFLILAASQRQMVKLVWRDIPDPNNCSWAQGLDFHKAEALENLFRPHERLTSCPLLLELDNISQAVVVERTKSPALGKDRDSPLGWAGKGQNTPNLHHSESFSGIVAAPRVSASVESLAQSRVAYGSVLPPREPRCHYRQDTSLGGFSDEGNFSANSDMSSSSLGVSWGPGGFASVQLARRRHSCSFDSVEEFSDPSDQEDESPEDSAFGAELALEDQEQTESFQGPAVMVNSTRRCEKSPRESVPLLCCVDSRPSTKGASADAIAVYIPQFQTLPKFPRGQDRFAQL